MSYHGNQAHETMIGRWSKRVNNKRVKLNTFNLMEASMKTARPTEVQILGDAHVS